MNNTIFITIILTFITISLNVKHQFMAHTAVRGNMVI